MTQALILIIHPDPRERLKLSGIVRDCGFAPLAVGQAKDALARLVARRPDLAIIDEEVKGLTPEALLKEIQARDLDTFTLVLTSKPDLSRATDLMTQGVFAVLNSPVGAEELRPVILRGLENQEAYHEVVTMAQELKAANAELEKEKAAQQEKAKELRFLYDLASELSTTLRAGEIVRVASEALGRLLGSRLVVYLTTFGRNGAPRLLADRPIREELGRAIGEDLMFEIDGDFGAEDLLIVQPDKEGLPLSRRPRHRITMALTAAGEECGVLGIYSPKPPRMNPDRWLLLESLALQSAQALFNAHQHESALEQASHDPLTGLFNRRAFSQRLENEFDRFLRYGTSMSLILLDLDHFKSVNDRFGHKSGDEVLVRAAGVIHEAVRSTDLAARYGGEEFAVVLPETRAEEALILARRIQSRLSESSFAFGSEVHRQTISQGVADARSLGVGDVEDLIRAADRALYLAKAEGRDRIRTADQTALTEVRKDEAYGR